MTDRRLVPANARVAAAELRDEIAAPEYVEGTWQRVLWPVVDLLMHPGGPRDRQLIFGERVRVLDRDGGFAFVQSGRDGYVGYLAETCIGADSPPTHRVSVPSSHLYPSPDLKVHEVFWLSFGSLLSIRETKGAYAETEDGLYVPRCHITLVGTTAQDPASVAALFLGTPYLWGGNSRMGIDCSGLVQAALMACGISCPADSDLQREALGQRLPDGTPARRGDLFFWKGHVAMAMDAETMIHANAHHMSVAVEPIAEALVRIATDNSTGPLLAHKRLD